MIVKETGDTFNCACGFSWLRGKSGAHDCGDGYRKQIAELRDELIAIREQQGKPYGYAFDDRRGNLQITRYMPTLAHDHHVPVVELFTAPQSPVVHPDTVRMDWLCAHVVEVREPMFYGSHAMFWSQCDSDDCEEHHTKLREQIDAALSAAPKPGASNA